jgi:hypothetical protein
MSIPVFEDVEPPPSCGCEGCARQRLTDALARGGGAAAASGATRAMVLAAAAATAFGGAMATATTTAYAAAPVPAPATGAAAGPGTFTGTPDSADPAGPAAAADPSAPEASPVPTADGGGADGTAPGAVQAVTEGDGPPADAAQTGAPAPLGTYGAPGSDASQDAHAPMRLARRQIMARAETWVARRVPYSMTSFWKDGYRQDCSGFVSMAWGLGTNAWTGDLHDYAVRIRRAALRPGDVLLFHNTAHPRRGSHVVLFGGWVDAAHTRYTGYEQTKPGTRVRTTPYAYWSHSARYLPYRYKYLKPGGGADGSERNAYPGPGAFGPGSDNSYVARLGSLLVGRGAGAYYKVGPGSAWGAADRAATRAFQRAQGWTGAAANGLPGPTTWQYLVRHRGRDVRVRPRAAVPAAAPTSPAADVPHYPGAAAFRPGRSSDAVLALGRMLAARGFGGHYRTGPSSIWSEADRRNVEAFQRAQGWSGRTADGHPGPETWRRLFT